MGDWRIYGHDLTDRLARRDNTKDYKNYKEFCSREALDLVSVCDKDIKRLAFVQKDINETIYNLFALNTHAHGYREGRKLAAQMAAKAKDKAARVFHEFKHAEKLLNSNKKETNDILMFMGRGYSQSQTPNVGNDLTEEELLQVIMQTENFTPGTTFRVSGLGNAAFRDTLGWIPPPNLGGPADDNQLAATIAAEAATLAEERKPKKKKRKRHTRPGPFTDNQMDIDDLPIGNDPFAAMSVDGKVHEIPLRQLNNVSFNSREIAELRRFGFDWKDIEEMQLNNVQPAWEKMQQAAEWRIQRRGGIDFDREIHRPLLNLDYANDHFMMVPPGPGLETYPHGPNIVEDDPEELKELQYYLDREDWTEFPVTDFKNLRDLPLDLKAQMLYAGQEEAEESTIPLWRKLGYPDPQAVAYRQRMSYYPTPVERVYRNPALNMIRPPPSYYTMNKSLGFRAADADWIARLEEQMAREEAKDEPVAVHIRPEMLSDDFSDQTRIRIDNSLRNTRRNINDFD